MIDDAKNGNNRSRSTITYKYKCNFKIQNCNSNTNSTHISRYSDPFHRDIILNSTIF